VLDAACGTGRITTLLARRGLQVTGCDISRAMMTVAHGRMQAALHRAIPLVQGRAQSLPYRDDAFAAASCIGLLMHLDRCARVRVLTELARVTRGPVVLQYGCLDRLRRPGVFAAGRPPGNVRFTIPVLDMQLDFARARLIECARFWILPGWSTSVVVVAQRRRDRGAPFRALSVDR
jgi:ubiquinone/menaquinone biosynthesis C-methylase UbiE